MLPTYMFVIFALQMQTNLQKWFKFYDKIRINRLNMWRGTLENILVQTNVARLLINNNQQFSMRKDLQRIIYLTYLTTHMQVCDV